MTNTRRLVLNRERLAELQSDELAAVVVGTAITSVYGCRTYEVTCWGCPTSLPIDQCPIQTR